MAGDPFCGVGWRFLDEVLVNRAVDIGTPWQGGLRGPSAAHFGLQRSLSAGRQFQPPSTTRRSASVSVPSRPASCLSGFAPVVWASPPSGRPGFGRDAFGGVVPAALAPATPNFLPVRGRAELAVFSARVLKVSLFARPVHRPVSGARIGLGRIRLLTQCRRLDAIRGGIASRRRALRTLVELSSASLSWPQPWRHLQSQTGTTLIGSQQPLNGAWARSLQKLSWNTTRTGRATSLGMATRSGTSSTRSSDSTAWPLRLRCRLF